MITHPNLNPTQNPKAHRTLTQAVTVTRADEEEVMHQESFRQLERNSDQLQICKAGRGSDGRVSTGMQLAGLSSISNGAKVDWPTITSQWNIHTRFADYGLYRVFFPRSEDTGRIAFHSMMDPRRPLSTHPHFLSHLAPALMPQT